MPTTNERLGPVARAWVAQQLRELADDIEKRRARDFCFTAPQEIMEMQPEKGDTAVQRALTGVKSIVVTWTENPLAVGDRVAEVHRVYEEAGALDPEAGLEDEPSAGWIPGFGMVVGALLCRLGLHADEYRYYEEAGTPGIPGTGIRAKRSTCKRGQCGRIRK